ncbi:hypothetical protein CCR94_08665 [Rhodoblastus sphagnicola]|uniref:Uncharacterized protein n=1 Tax=Rhodoblastus sphagnicola TaxID=333368 RepID=A0A2S6NAA3_9HYPH|nr:hypothetical protein CCR94_08665 [Rhodoblastus sphagnicola]
MRRVAVERVRPLVPPAEQQHAKQAQGAESAGDHGEDREQAADRRQSEPAEEASGQGAGEADRVRRALPPAAPAEIMQPLGLRREADP